MKRIILSFIVLFSGLNFYGQMPSSQDLNLVIGLPKASATELAFVRNELEKESQIVSAEFVFKDHVLLIEVDPKITPYLKFADIESILIKYFNKSDIHEKQFLSFKELKMEYIKDDKYRVK